jgi:NAD(P)-dependent dehydrogenase (short-subunit alcohol dehydrogenase family)
LLQALASEGRAAGARLETVRADVTDPQDRQQMVEAARSRFGGLDILINNAGIGATGHFADCTAERLRSIMEVNFFGLTETTRVFLPMLKEGVRPAIVNISSIAGRNPLPNGAAYAASKWALNGLSYSVAEELRRYNIRVSVVCPGSVHTDFSPHAGKDAGKMLQADDVAHAVAMLVTQAPQSFCSEIVLRPTQKP